MGWFIWASLGVGVPSVIIAIFCLILLGSSKKFYSPFYRLVQISIVIDLLCYLNTWADKILAHPTLAPVLIPVYNLSKWFFIIHTFLGHLFFHLQSGCFLVLCIFRLTVIRIPNATEKWSRYYPFVFLLLLTASSIFTIPFSLINGLDVISFDGTAVHRDISGWKNFIYFMYIESTTYMLLTITAWFKTTKTVSGLLSETIRKDFKYQITKVLACDMILHIAVMVWEILTDIGVIPAECRMIALFCVSDMMSLSRPFFLLLLDGHVHEKLRGWKNRLTGKVVDWLMAYQPSATSNHNAGN